jgi:hypothetical protein
MSKIEKDDDREYRISMEAIVDAYGPEEQALGWYYYLEGKIRFPFDAKCVRERSISPLRLDEKVKVLGMADEDDCLVEMFVIVEWAGRSLGAPLVQLIGIDVDDQTEEAIADWHYWVGRGYLLCG